MDMTFKLQVFEGPLDLLLYLIEKNKVIFMISRLSRLQRSTWSMWTR